MNKYSHDVKCQVFKNNYGKLRDGFRSSGYHIKGFLYSQDVINAETRDTHDVEKVLADVEIKLKFSEPTWETLLSGMSEPPLDVLCDKLKKELEIELSAKSNPPSYQINSPLLPPNVPRSLPIPDERNSKITTKHVIDSGCGSTTMFEYHNYPDNCFPSPAEKRNIPQSPAKSDPSSASTTDTNMPPFAIIPSPSSTNINSNALSVDSSVDPLISTTTTNSPYTMPSDRSTDHTDYSAIVSPDNVPNGAIEGGGTQRSSSNDSGHDSPLTLPPVPAASHHLNSVSELVNSLQTNKKIFDSQLVNDTPNEFGASIYKRITDLQVENNSLRITRKQISDQIKNLEDENEYLMEKRKVDRQMLEIKMHQVAQENQLLVKQQEFMHQLEDENRKLKKEIRASFSQQEFLIKRNEELMFQIQIAERNTSLSAITIDELKREIATLNTIIHQLREETSQYREWYNTLSSCNNKDNDKNDLNNDNYLSTISHAEIN